MTGAVTDHLWQSSLFVLGAWIIASAFRGNGAHVRHRIWLVASLKFLVPLTFLISLGGALPQIAPVAVLPTAADVPDLSIAIDQITQPFTSGAFAPSGTNTETATHWFPWLIAGLWAGGFVSVVSMRVRGWQRVRRAVRASEALPVKAPVPIRSAPGLLEPGVVGLWRPVLLVPAGIDRHLTAQQFEAVLAHELCHVKRRDNLTSAAHMIVEAVFWFHPLVWFVGARLVDERERACDEHVLRVCGDPATYAESILNVCKLYVESPVACVSGVSGADLKKRIAAIMRNHVGLQLNLARKIALVAAAALAIALPLAAGMVTAPLRAATQGSAATPQGKKFEVASIKPCEPGAPVRGRSGGAGQASPGYLHLSCLTLRQLVLQAYAGPGSRLLNRKWEEQFIEGFPAFVKGGPAWAYSDRWTIEAKAEGIATREVMIGPMLRALLEDRFQLKHHRESEERSMLALTVVKGGLKIQPTVPGSCWERDLANPGPRPPGIDKAPCGMATGNGWGSAGFIGVLFGDPDRDGERFTDYLWRYLLRPIIDRTGLTGRYTFDLEFTPDDTTPGVSGRCGGNPDCMANLAANGMPDDRPTAFKNSANLFKALEPIGFKLDQVRAPYEFIVIDSAERPKPDPPSPDAPFSRGFGGASSPAPVAEVRR